MLFFSYQKAKKIKQTRIRVSSISIVLLAVSFYIYFASIKNRHLSNQIHMENITFIDQICKESILSRTQNRGK